MKELEDEGYVVRVQSRDERGRMSRNKYTVYALPQKEIFDRWADCVDEEDEDDYEPDEFFSD